jgi:hypothetical protein
VFVFKQSRDYSSTGVGVFYMCINYVTLLHVMPVCSNSIDCRAVASVGGGGGGNSPPPPPPRKKKFFLIFFVGTKSKKFVFNAFLGPKLAK